MNSINWRVRIKNKNFWLTIIPAFLLFIQTILKIFGVALDLGELGNQLLAVVDSAFLILTLLGVVNDPTTIGLGDSPRAMEYNEPKGYLQETETGDEE